jgi:integrase
MPACLRSLRQVSASPAASLSWPAQLTRRNVATELAQTAWAWNGRPLSAMPDVSKAIQLRAGELSPATIKNRIAYLRAAVRYAWKHYGLGDTDPGARVTVPTVRNERHVYLDRAQMLALARACEHRPTRALIRIGFYSGMRYGEVIRAEVVDGRFLLRDTKNGDPRIIPIHPRIRCCLSVPKTSRFTMDYWFGKARTAAGMPYVRFHDLRHSAASALINAGVDLYTVGTVLGHRSAASTKRYAHLATERQEAAILKIGRRA